MLIMCRCHTVTVDTKAIPMKRYAGYTVSEPTPTLVQFYERNKKISK